MRLSLSALAAAALLAGADAFAPLAVSQPRPTFAPLAMSTAAEAPAMADSGVPAEHSSPSETVADADIPTNLPSDCGMDYIPLATMLATGQLAEADQVSVKGETQDTSTQIAFSFSYVFFARPRVEIVRRPTTHPPLLTNYNRFYLFSA